MLLRERLSRLKRLKTPTGILGFIVALLSALGYAWRWIETWDTVEFLLDKIPTILGYFTEPFGYLTLLVVGFVLVTWALLRPEPVSVGESDGQTNYEEPTSWPAMTAMPAVLPNIILTNCFTTRLYLQKFGENRLSGYVDVVMAEFVNQPSERTTEADRRVSATLSFFADDGTTKLIERTIPGIWKHAPLGTWVSYHEADGTLAGSTGAAYLLHTGNPQLLYVVGKMQDGICQPIDAEHFVHIHPDYRLPLCRILVHVHITGDELDQEWWIAVENRERENAADRGLRVYYDTG